MLIGGASLEPAVEIKLEILLFWSSVETNSISYLEHYDWFTLMMYTVFPRLNAMVFIAFRVFSSVAFIGWAALFEVGI